jgi:hypothetical protein
MNNSRPATDGPIAQETHLAVAELDASPWTRPRERGRERAIKRDAVLRAAASSSTVRLPRHFAGHGRGPPAGDQADALLRAEQGGDPVRVRRLGLELLRAAIAGAAASGGSAVDKLKAAMPSTR